MCSHYRRSGVVHIELYTPDPALNASVSVPLLCEELDWLWGVYDLLGMDTAMCHIDGPMMEYAYLRRRMRIEGDASRMKLSELKSIIRLGCRDELRCMAHRLLKFNDALGPLARYYSRLNELGSADRAKLALAFAKYGMVDMGLRVARTIEEPIYRALALIASLEPTLWPRHVTLRTRLLEELPWLLLRWNHGYLLAINSLGRHHTVSNMNINLEGGRLVIDDQVQIQGEFDDHVELYIISRSGYGIYFWGSWSGDAARVSFPAAGLVKSRYFELRINLPRELMIPPRSYASLVFNALLIE